MSRRQSDVGMYGARRPRFPLVCSTHGELAAASRQGDQAIKDIYLLWKVVRPFPRLSFVSLRLFRHITLDYDHSITNFVIG